MRIYHGAGRDELAEELAEQLIWKKAYEAGKQEGRKEVVGWVDRHHKHSHNWNFCSMLLKELDWQEQKVKWRMN